MILPPSEIIVSPDSELSPLLELLSLLELAELLLSSSSGISGLRCSLIKLVFVIFVVKKLDFWLESFWFFPTEFAIILVGVARLFIGVP